MMASNEPQEMSVPVGERQPRVTDEGVLILDEHQQRGNGRRWARTLGVALVAAGCCALVFVGVRHYRHRRHDKGGKHGHHHGSDDEFRHWMTEYGKSYDSLHEYMLRRDIYFHNKAKVDRHNGHHHAEGLLGAVQTPYHLKLNHFADLTETEFSKTHASCWLGGLKVLSKPSLGTFSYSGADLPEELDWRSDKNANGKAAVTPIKNQGQCGSCWSFSATGALEGHWANRGHDLVSLSEQQLIDCSRKEGNMGCNGGLMDNAFLFEERVGVCTEESYPYTSGTGQEVDQCLEDKCNIAVPTGQIVGFKDVEKNSQKALMEALTHGPVSIAIEADQPIFQFYHKGIVMDHGNKTCGTQLDHGVLLVGYGHEMYKGKDTGYWIVKNSWGPGWGDQGYIKLHRPLESEGASDEAEGGECGLLMSASFPVFAGENVVPTPQLKVKAPAGDGHYGAPPCPSGDAAVRIDGMDGAYCAPQCDSNGNCPTPPAGTSAQAQCALQSPDGDHFCGLLCNPANKGECPAGASCQAVPNASGVGLCLFGDSLGTTPAWIKNVHKDSMIYH